MVSYCLHQTFDVLSIRIGRRKDIMIIKIMNYSRITNRKFKI